MIRRAYQFATAAHQDQYRMYTGEPYILHLIRVTGIVKEITNDETVLDAAMLHETIKHTRYTYNDLARLFGEKVANLVQHVTTHCSVTDSAAKKRGTIKLLEQMPIEAKIIKLADMIDHTQAIIDHDFRLAQDFVRDQMLIIKALRDADPKLFKKANWLLNYYISDIANTRFELSQNQSQDTRRLYRCAK